MAVPDYKDAVWLKNAYLHKKQTMNAIASSCGVSPMTIQNWLDRHQIPTRPRGRTVASSVAPQSAKDFVIANTASQYLFLPSSSSKTWSIHSGRS